MAHKYRSARDKEILIGLSNLSLPERFKRVRDLEDTLRNMEAEFERKRTNKNRTKKQETQLVADEDGIIELRCRFVLERAEYLALKEISPDYIEGAG